MRISPEAKVQAVAEGAPLAPAIERLKEEGKIFITKGEADETLVRIAHENGCRIIYTDGSVVEGRAAAAMVEADVDGRLDIRAWPFSCLAESFEAEREAIRAACEKVASSACPNRNVLILTDSLSNIDALDSPKYRDAEAVSLYKAVKNAAEAISAGGGWLEIR